MLARFSGSMYLQQSAGILARRFLYTLRLDYRHSYMAGWSKVVIPAEAMEATESSDSAGYSASANIS